MEDLDFKMTDDTLQHYGVKGMKWGKRRIRDTITTAKTNRAVKKEAKIKAKDAKWEAKSKSRLREIENGVNYTAQHFGTYNVVKNKAKLKKVLEEMYEIESQWYIKSKSPSGRKKAQIYLDKEFKPQMRFVDRK